MQEVFHIVNSPDLTIRKSPCIGFAEKIIIEYSVRMQAVQKPMRRIPGTEEVKEQMKKLFTIDDFSVAVISRRTSRIYASLYASLKKAGTPIPTNDIWIAAVTIEYGGVLLTNDRHLLSVERLRTVKY